MEPDRDCEIPDKYFSVQHATAEDYRLEELFHKGGKKPMQHVQEIRKAKALETVDEFINWKEVAEVHADTLDRVLNALWQQVHPGPNNWEYPDQVVLHVVNYIAELKAQFQRPVDE